MSGILRTVYDELIGKTAEDFAEIVSLSQQDMVSPLTSAPATRSMAQPASKRTSMFFSTKPKPVKVAKATEDLFDAGKAEIYTKCLTVCLKTYFPVQDAIADGANKDYRARIRNLPSVDDTAKLILMGNEKAIGKAYSQLPKDKQDEVVGNNPFLRLYLYTSAEFMQEDDRLTGQERAFLSQLKTCYLAAEQYLTFATHMGKLGEAERKIQELIGTPFSSLKDMLKVLSFIESKTPTSLGAIDEDTANAKAAAGENHIALDKGAMFRSTYSNLVKNLYALGREAQMLSEEQKQHSLKS